MTRLSTCVLIGVLLVLSVFGPGARPVLAEMPLELKKVSELRTERERVLYIFDLGEAGGLEGKSWREVEPLFDLGSLKYDTDKADKRAGKTVMAYLTQQPDGRPRTSPDSVAASTYSGWCVLFELGSAEFISKFRISHHPAKPQQPGLKKVSELPTERERVLYIYDLAEAGGLEGKFWREVEPIFDFRFIKYDNDDFDKTAGKTVVANLLRQLPDRPRTSPDDVSARAFLGWYVVFELDSKELITKLSISNYHK